MHLPPGIHGGQENDEHPGGLRHRGQKRSNAMLWKTVLLYTSRLGSAPRMICADCNFELSSDGDIPREVFTTLQ